MAKNKRNSGGATETITPDDVGQMPAEVYEEVPAEESQIDETAVPGVQADITHGRSQGRMQVKCPMGRDTFEAEARPIKILIGDQGILADPKVFSTGSFGWYGTGKVMAEVDGIPVKAQVTINITVIGSKPEKK